jgi:branched-chain amino acid transport system ATP-binding protein
VTDTTKSPVASTTDAKPLAVRINDVTMEFAGLRVLREVQLEIAAGASMAIVGPNGSGKTTLLNIISGIYRPVAGTIAIGDTNVTGYRPHRVAALGVGRTFQHIEVPRELPALRVAMLGRHTRMKAGVLAYSFGIPYFNKTEQRNVEAARAALRLVGLEDLATRPVGDLPYGVAKRVDLARALAAEPRILLLDEPAAGLNDREREDLLELLLRVKRERDLTLVVVEHDMSFIAALCGTVIVLVGGRKIYDGDTSQLHNDAAVVEALLGTAPVTE